jgi:hypothetical protein
MWAVASNEKNNIKVKVRICLRLIKEAVKIYGGVEV